MISFWRRTAAASGSSITASDAYLFRPADAINIVQGDDNGTPLQKDEPQAQNAPNGAVIDYYLKAAPSGPVTLEILDSSGKRIHTFTSAAAPEPASTSSAAAGIPKTSALWRTPAEPFSPSAGMHRVVWNPITDPVSGAPNTGAAANDGPQRGTPLTGAFTARLTVNGKSYAQPFVVKPDPRSRAR